MIQFSAVSKAQFLNDYWQQKPLLIRNALPDFVPPISAEELAGLSLEEEVESRIVIQHSDTDYELKKGPFPESVYQELPEENWTLLVQGMDRLIPEINSLLNEFNFIPRWRIDDIMVSYAAVGGNVGPHYDHYDVFLLQAQGERRWQLSSQNCTAENHIEGVDLRLMKTFVVEDDMVCQPGDILYIPPKWGHHGIGLTDDCMTFSIGYRSYQGQELWDSLGDHLSEMSAFQASYQDPTWSDNLNPGEITDKAVTQAQALLLSALQDKSLLKTWFGRFATQLDAEASRQLPEPLTEDETPEFEAFCQALTECNGMEKDPVCRFAYARNENETLLYINGAIWDKQGAEDDFIAALCNQNELSPNDLQRSANHALLFDLWQLQFLVFIE